MERSVEDQRAFDIVKKLFKNDYGEPFEMTEGQIALFRSIYERDAENPKDIRLQFDCYTQYGKSDIVSMAVLLRASTFQEKWIILGATKDKANIIMGKLIKHIFENDYTLGKFQIDEGESMDFIRRNRSKDNITFKVDDNGVGQVITLSADARRKSDDAGDILIGHGGQNLIEDDAALIPDKIHGKAMRMLGGHSGKSFLLKITNSFGNNHAKRSRYDPKYTKFVYDYKQGLAEGRLTEEFIDEMRAALDPIMFGILYECVYPPGDMVEDGGWMPYLTEEHVKEAQSRKVQSSGKKRMALDVAEGTNYNSFVTRTDNYMYVREKSLEPDLMKTADRFLTILTEDRIDPGYTWIDAVAIGAGVVARVIQQGVKTNAFKGGEKPTEKTKAEQDRDPIEYYNLRAEVYWKMRTWILQGGALDEHKDWMQLIKLRYRTTSDKKIQMMSKEEMRARGLLMTSESTDTPDAGSMTFAPVKIIVYNKASAAVLPYYPELGF